MQIVWLAILSLLVSRPNTNKFGTNISAVGLMWALEETNARIYYLEQDVATFQLIAKKSY